MKQKSDVLSDAQRDAMERALFRIRKIAQRIDEFSSICEANEYTDTGDAWTEFRAIRRHADVALSNLVKVYS